MLFTFCYGKYDYIQIGVFLVKAITSQQCKIIVLWPLYERSKKFWLNKLSYIWFIYRHFTDIYINNEIYIND